MMSFPKYSMKQMLAGSSVSSSSNIRTEWINFVCEVFSFILRGTLVSKLYSSGLSSWHSPRCCLAHVSINCCFCFRFFHPFRAKEKEKWCWDWTQVFFWPNQILHLLDQGFHALELNLKNNFLFAFVQFNCVHLKISHRKKSEWFLCLKFSFHANINFDLN